MLAAKQEAQNDAVKATSLKPDWPKGFFRYPLCPSSQLNSSTCQLDSQAQNSHCSVTLTDPTASLQATQASVFVRTGALVCLEWVSKPAVSSRIVMDLCCRLGMACLAMYQYGPAAAAFARGLSLDPNNKELAARKATAEAHKLYEDACLKAQLGAHRRNLVLKLRAVRSLISIPNSEYVHLCADPRWRRNEIKR